MDSFRPRKFLGGRHVQTIYNAFFPPQNNLRSKYLCEDIYLPLGDGDVLVLEHNPPLEWTGKFNKPFNGYYILLIHGMEGSSESHYMISTAKNALERGYGVVRMNMRNCGKGFGFSKKPYSAGHTSDVESVLRFMKNNFSQNLVVSGFSLSANLILKYFGETRDHIARYFSAVSPPLDLKKTCEFIDSPSGKFYRKYFLDTLHEKVRSGIFGLEREFAERASKCKTFFDFDDFVTAPLCGYKGVLDYYAKCSSINFIPKIRHKGIVIHAEDDPVVPSKVWHEVAWHRIQNIQTVFTKKGGHVGFLAEESSQVPEGRWLSGILLDFFDTQINERLA
ncbi:YheT family hydrolase [Leptospira sp. GIMC2001]|uniref:YheT family hydrolase n=1 Tax=Leptospira sp. GIMC2001 TaxID=1513297 RepID=UPI00234BD18E|nr:alpha/beta fold hydrolase [Leptospira sp. GIMC2001]WCL48031.1 alpha/beta fold hydrolase [Leptospira sp. GIMC2001]